MQRDDRIQIAYLKQVYEWYFKKLAAMGAISKAELETEVKMLNPNSGSMAASMASVIKNKVEAFLVDEKETAEWHKAMFEDEQYGERTLHRDIPPANMRIKNFDRKELKEYSARVDEIKQREALNAEKK